MEPVHGIEWAVVGSVPGNRMDTKSPKSAIKYILVSQSQDTFYKDSKILNFSRISFYWILYIEKVLNPKGCLLKQRMSPEVVLIGDFLRFSKRLWSPRNVWLITISCSNPAPYIEKEVLFTKAENIPRYHPHLGAFFALVPVHLRSWNLHKLVQSNSASIPANCCLFVMEPWDSSLHPSRTSSSLLKCFQYAE